VWDALTLELLDWEVPATIYTEEKKWTHEMWKLFTWTSWLGILEPWKGLGYTRRNTPFAVGAGGGTRVQGRRISYLVEVEDTVSTSWEKEESQLEELEYEHSSEEPEDHVNARQPIPRKSKPFQSLFELEDIASPYGGGERGVR
jgi:hypothetical protein